MCKFYILIFFLLFLVSFWISPTLRFFHLLGNFEMILSDLHIENHLCHYSSTEQGIWVSFSIRGRQKNGDISSFFSRLPLVLTAEAWWKEMIRQKSCFSGRKLPFSPPITGCITALAYVVTDGVSLKNGWKWHLPTQCFCLLCVFRVMSDY